MSNAAVGNLYSTIIDRIVDVARNDFEEGGIPQETLEELKQQWRENLSSLQVAQLPWDPPPTPPHPQTLPSNATKADPAPASAAAASQAKTGGVPNGGAYVKQEPKQEPYQTYPNGYANPGLNPMAGERARQLLEQQFGSQANASIHAAGLVQQGGPRPLSLPGQQQQAQQPQGHQQQQQQQQQQRPTHIQLPGQGPPRPPNGAQYSQQQSSLSNAQADGSGDAHEDWNEVMSLQRADGQHGRMAADGILRAQLERNIAVTDSGLFAPLDEQPKKKQHIAASLPSSSRQVDGGDDDDDIKAKIELDEDAINSDLDDKDDVGEAVDDDGDGPVGETILCTYDKVQRVKNKWKCTLKDGILTTQGREYVFHKANGEFEW